MFVARKSGWALALVVSLTALASPLAAKTKCVMAGGEGSNVLPDVAKFMANAALENSIKANGWQAAGKVKQSCKTDVVMTTCVSRQRACPTVAPKKAKAAVVKPAATATKPAKAVKAKS